MSIYNDDTVLGNRNWPYEFIEASYSRESDLHKWKFIGRAMAMPPKFFSGQIEGREIFFKVCSVEQEGQGDWATFKFKAEEQR